MEENDRYKLTHQWDRAPFIENLKKNFLIVISFTSYRYLQRCPNEFRSCILYSCEVPCTFSCQRHEHQKPGVVLPTSIDVEGKRGSTTVLSGLPSSLGLFSIKRHVGGNTGFFSNYDLKELK